MKQEVNIFHPRALPCKGIRTAVSPLALSDGEFQELDNLRVKDEVIQVRNGMSASLGDVLASASLRGYWQGVAFNGTAPNNWITVVALRVSTATRLYVSTDLTSWTEVTEASGKYGNSRISNDGIVRFTAVPNPFQTSGTVPSFKILAACDNNYPRLITGTSAGNCAIIEDVPPQTASQDFPLEVKTVEGYIDLQGATAYTNSGANFTGADNGTAPNQVARITIGTATANGDTVNVASSGASLTSQGNSLQILVGVKTDYPQFWDKIGLKIAGGVTVWDPTDQDSYSSPKFVDLDPDGKTLWVFEFPDPGATLTFDDFTLTWEAATAEAPATAQTADIFLAAFTYAAIATDDLDVALCNFNSSTYTESPPVIFYGERTTARIKDIGGPVYSDIRIPQKTGILRAQYYCVYHNVATTDRDKGVDSLTYYGQEPGAEGFRYLGTDAVASYSGSWSYSTGTAGSRERTSIGPNNVYQSLPFLDVPTEYNIAIPKSSEVRYVNERLLAGGGTGAARGFYASELKNPFRMATLPAMDQGGTTFLSLNSEYIKAIVPVPATQFGTHGVIVITDQNAYATYGNLASDLSRLSRISSYGTLSPYSAVEHKGVLYYLDADMQLRYVSGGASQPLSRGRVDDILAGIPGSRRQYVTSCFHNETLYLGYTPSAGSSNSKVLVWDAESNAFTTDTPAKPVEGFLRWFDATNNVYKLIAIGLDSTTLKSYEYDQAGEDQDLGTTDITVALKTRRWLGARAVERFALDRVCCLMDDSNGGTITTTRTYVPAGNTAVSSFSTDVSSGDVWRYDYATPPTLSAEGSGAGGDIRFTGALKGGTNIYALSVEIAGRGKGADA